MTENESPRPEGTPTTDASPDDESPFPAERSSLVGEFWAYLMENKKWWMIPILAVIVIMGILIALAATGAAPFIYPLM